jgi:hypothetical protein
MQPQRSSAVSSSINSASSSGAASTRRSRFRPCETPPCRLCLALSTCRRKNKALRTAQPSRQTPHCTTPELWETVLNKAFGSRPVRYYRIRVYDNAADNGLAAAMSVEASLCRVRGRIFFEHDTALLVIMMQTGAAMACSASTTVAATIVIIARRVGKCPTIYSNKQQSAAFILLPAPASPHDAVLSVATPVPIVKIPARVQRHHEFASAVSVPLWGALQRVSSRRMGCKIISLLMRHQHRYFCIAEDITCHPTEDGLPHPAVRERAHN